jgi:diguanylate cyclase (GGDEF)-like protein
MGQRSRRRDGKEIGVAFGDVDGLKRINDTLGHLEGDRAIAAVGNLLAATFRSADAVTRISGDEFYVLLLIAGHESFATGAPRIK